MSAEASSAPVSDARRPEGFLGLVRFAVLLVLAALLASVAYDTVKALRRAPVDASAVAAELLAGPLPFDLVLRDAVRTPDGNRVVTFGRPAGETAEVPDASGPEAGASGPLEVVVVDYASSAFVTRLFQKTPGELGMQLAEWEKDPAKPWHGTLHLGDLGWGTWTARLKIERSFLAGGGWEDVAQVDLSRPEVPRVLFARWPREVEAREAEVLRILSAMRLEPPEPEAPVEDD